MLKLKPGTQFTSKAGITFAANEIQAEKRRNGKWYAMNLNHDEVPADLVESAEELPMSKWKLS